jgi:RND family efflux transporter MFP subunit
MIRHHQQTLRVLLGGSLLLFSTVASSAEIEGFSEPWRTIDIAAADSGIVAELLVSEGTTVAAGELLGQLHLSVHEAALAAACKAAESQGRLQSAQADLKLKADRLQKLQGLLENKHASQEEVDRAVLERDIAAAQLLAVQEDLELRLLEQQRIAAQLEQRRFRSPISGIVSKIDKEPGEFVSANDPVILQIVQLDQLRLVFSVPAEHIPALRKLDTVRIRCGELPEPIAAKIDFISPLIDPQSSTVRVKVRLPNPEGLYPCGTRCWLILDQPQQQPLPAKPAVPGKKSPGPVLPRAAQNSGTPAQ